MLKKAAIVFASVVVVVAAVVWVTDFRVMFDGSGWRPRFESSTPDYAALEADRARQRQAAALPAEVASPASLPTPTTAAAAPAPPSQPIAEADASPGVESRARWTDFRGPDRDGRIDVPIRTEWPREGLPLLWKQPVGPGYASFVVADGRAFTIEQRRRQEVVAAYDVRTGRELWTNGWDGEFVESQGGDGPRATPTYHEGRLYALGAVGELRCLDARTGAVIWRRNILADAGASNLDWGMAAAPLIVDETVVVLPGGRGGKSIAAYSKATGAPVWTSLDDQAGYASPMLVTIGGMRQLLVVTASRVVGVTPESGRLLWEYSWATFNGINAAQPLLLGDNRIFVSSSYGQGAAVLEVTRSGAAFSARTVWQNNRMKNKFTSSVLHRGYIYGLDESILACIDATTGDLKWKGGRYGYGQILLVGDHLIALTEDGEVALVKATPERHQELAKFDAINGKTWNHPVVVDGRLLVRNIREMAAFDIRPR